MVKAKKSTLVFFFYHNSIESLNWGKTKKIRGTTRGTSHSSLVCPSISLVPSLIRVHHHALLPCQISCAAVLIFASAPNKLVTGHHSYCKIWPCKTDDNFRNTNEWKHFNAKKILPLELVLLSQPKLPARLRCYTFFLPTV